MESTDELGHAFPREAAIPIADGPPSVLLSVPLSVLLWCSSRYSLGGPPEDRPCSCDTRLARAGVSMSRADDDEIAQIVVTDMTWTPS